MYIYLKYLFSVIFCISLVFYAQIPASTSIYGTRVQAAKYASDQALRKLFTEKGVAYPPKSLYMRVFKSENIWEVWASNDAQSSHTLIKSYEVCAMSGMLGPKRMQGDLQVPEGYYKIAHFNPWSTYYLSMKVNYPNKSDRLRSAHRNLGGDIFMHGECKSIGCVSVTTDNIKEIYWMTAQARHFGKQRHIPVHIFPTRLGDMKFQILEHLYASNPALRQLWAELKQGYDHFEASQIPPEVRIGAKGEYIVKPRLMPEAVPMLNTEP